MPGWITAAARRVVRDYGGDASRIWTTEPATAAAIRARFDAFDGIGQKKAAMAVEILARDLLAGLGLTVDLVGSPALPLCARLRPISSSVDDPSHQGGRSPDR